MKQNGVDFAAHLFHEDPLWQMQHIVRAFQAQMRRYDYDGKNHPPPLILILLAHNGKDQALDQKELSDQLGVRPATITVALKRMEKCELVQKKADPCDLRRNLIQITPKGLALVDRHISALRQTYEKALSNFEQDELRSLKDYLQRILHNLEAPVPEKNDRRKA